jgi:rhodanese-related sulfurtransferase
MKQFILQLSAILGLSLAVGLTYNYFSKTPLPLFKQYDPHMVDLVIGNQTGKNTLPGEFKIPHFQEIDADTLQALVEAEKAMLLDARTPESFKQCHIPGAVSLPISRFNETYDGISPQLKQYKTIICYCEGHDCTDSTLLALELFKKGHTDIFVYKGGMAEWEQLAYPVETPQENERREN